MRQAISAVTKTGLRRGMNEDQPLRYESSGLEIIRRIALRSVSRPEHGHAGVLVGHGDGGLGERRAPVGSVTVPERVASPVCETTGRVTSSNKRSGE